MKSIYQHSKRSSHPPTRSTFFSAVLKPLNLVALALAATQLPSLSQDVAAAVGWWPEGSNPTVVAEQIGGSTLEMIVRRAGKMETAFTVDWKTTDTGTATPGADFQASGGTLTFAAGEDEKVVQIPILDDGLLEYPETIDLRLFNASGGIAITNPTTSAVIVDNEIPPTLDSSVPRPFDLLPLLPYNIGSPDILAAVLPDGGILQFDLETTRLLRFGADGTLLSFSRPIHVRITEIQEHALLATPDNKAILSGDFTEVNGIARPGIVRLLLDGTVDETFKAPPDLKSSDFFRTLTVQRDGRILLQLGFNRMIRLLETGSLDPSFTGLDGFVASALELTSGAILVRPGPEPGWLRLLPNGALDQSFHPAIRECKECYSFATPDGSVIVTDFTTDPTQRFRKMKPDGSLDANFHVPAWIHGVGPALPDGRVFASGGYSRRGWGGVFSTDFFVILRPDGSIDESHPGFVLGGDGDASGTGIAALSESVGVAVGSVGSVNGRSEGTRVLLRGPFKNLLYSSSGSVVVGNQDMRALVELVRSGETTGPASVRYRTRDGTAKAGAQYVAASGEVTFAPLENRKLVEIALLPRSVFTETFEVVLEHASGAEVAGSPTTVSILGRQPRFGPSPLQFLVNSSALISVLDLDYNFYQVNEGWTLEASEDLKVWTAVTDALNRYGEQGRLMLDFGASMQAKRFYRLRKL